MSLRIELDHCGHTWTASGSPIDLSLPVNPHSGLPRAWYRGPATAEPVRSDGWTGSISEGGSVNFRDVTFNPHAHGTHTETREHIRNAFHPIDALARSGALPFLMPALLVDAQPEQRSSANGDDWVVPMSALESAAPNVRRWAPNALLLRCTTGDVHRDWSNSNPPYLEAGFAEQLVELGIEHLLIDLPSVDREVDGGVLRAHNTFFGDDPSTRPNATISELLSIPQGLTGGPGLLAMQVRPFVNDAAPSRPVFFPATISADPPTQSD